MGTECWTENTFVYGCNSTRDTGILVWTSGLEQHLKHLHWLDFGPGSVQSCQHASCATSLIKHGMVSQLYVIKEFCCKGPRNMPLKQKHSPKNTVSVIFTRNQRSSFCAGLISDAVTPDHHSLLGALGVCVWEGGDLGDSFSVASPQ